MSRDLILVSLSLMTWGVGEGMFYFFQPLYMQQLGANPVMIGMILGIIGFTMMISHLPAGYISDRIGRRPVLILAWLIGCSATWIMGLANTLPVFVAGSALYGFTSFVVAPLNGYITTARGKMSVGRALTLISASFNVGAILGPILGGLIGNRYGLGSSFRVAGFVFLLSTITIFFIKPQPVSPPIHSNLRKGARSLLSLLYIKYLILIFFVMFALYLPIPLSQNFLQNERGINLVKIGQLLSARSAGVVILSLTLGQLNARIGFLITQVGMALFTLLILRNGGFLSYIIAYILLGSFQTARNLAVAQGRLLINKANMGLGYGMMETVMSIAMLLAPPLAGILYSRDPTWIYIVSFILICLSLLITIIFSPIKTEMVEAGLPEELELT